VNSFRKALTATATCWLLTGCAGNQSALEVHGPNAEHIEQLIIGFVAICSLVWMAVLVVLLWALLRPKDKPPQTDAPLERGKNVVVGAAVCATVIVICGFTTASFFTTRALSHATAGDLTIKISGEQWWWRITYANPDPALSFETANEIHIPVGRNVHLQLEAADVIHSFWVPSLSGKQDLVPGRSNELSIRADRSGVYRGQCSQFCGLQHGHMAVLVIAESEVDFGRWSEGQRRQAAAPVDEEAQAGERVFLTKPCAACHTIRGLTTTANTGPDLTHVGDRQTIAAGVFETTRGSLAAWIADPQTIKPGNNMPQVTLSGDELRQVSSYLAGLK
jgi:cytochrome c oxidase subunit 2